MSVLPFSDFEKRLDDLTMALLLPLRTSKVVDQAAMNGVRQLLTDLGAAIAGEHMVPKNLVGKLYFVFSQMLAEAGHAKSPGPILAAAWDIEERLTRIFGPRFD
jgi:hypothetical protein